MQSNYKRIGDYIKEVKEKNVTLEASLLLGININKFFMPSVANVIGTDMSNYRIVKKNQFACNRMHVGRDYRIPVALSNRDEPFMVSPAYDVFEIIDSSVLLPEYLMMWFSRKEFDRNAWFYTDADVRGGLQWKAFCDMQLPIPSPEKQREIVREYNVIQNRILLNNQLITKLEETAQAIYKQWFVDFEFPDENGLPYKSNGGEMIWCEELENEIPVGWEVDFLGSYAKISAGGDKPKIFSNIKSDLCKIPIISNSSNNEGIYGYTNHAIIFDKCITISARGAIIGYTVLRLNPFVPIVRLIVVKPLNIVFLNYLFYTVLNFKFDNQTSSAQGQLTVPDISSYRVIKPFDSILLKFQNQSFVIINNIASMKKENQKLEELKELLLAKMTRVESEKELV